MQFDSVVSCLNQKAKEASAVVMQQLDGAESEVKSLQLMTQRMILTQEEMVCVCIVAWSY